MTEPHKPGEPTDGGDEVLRALEMSIGAFAPDDPSVLVLRVRLSSLHYAAGRFAPALDQAGKVLTLKPDDVGALSIAASAASAMGLHSLADQYRATHESLLALDSAPPAKAPAAEVQSQPEAIPVRDSDTWDGGDPDRVTFDDVAGMEDVKQRLHRSFLVPLANAELRAAFSKQLRGGLLLWGPPGTGKTFIARALSGELGAAFLSATPADIFNSYFGGSEGNVARLFNTARRTSPAVLFLDELDAVGGRRSGRNTDQARGVVNQLLIELDGMTSNEGVFVLAATNAPWDVDDALRRPGRFDRTVLVLPPDEPARRALLTGALRGRPVGPDVNPARIAKETETYSGADLVRLVEAASERALTRSVAMGTVSPISSEDLQAARSDTPPSTHAWLSTAAMYVAQADEGEDFRELRAYLRRHRIA